MIYQLLMMAAICFAAFTSIPNPSFHQFQPDPVIWANAKCGPKVGDCYGLCRLKIQTLVDCRIECGEEPYKRNLKDNGYDSPCVFKCWSVLGHECRKKCMGVCGVEVYTLLPKSKRQIKSEEAWKRKKNESN